MLAIVFFTVYTRRLNSLSVPPLWVRVIVGPGASTLRQSLAAGRAGLVKTGDRRLDNEARQPEMEISPMRTGLSRMQRRSFAACVVALVTLLYVSPALAGNFYWAGHNQVNGTSWSQAVNTLGGSNWSSSPLFYNGTSALPGAADDVFFYLAPVNLNTVLGQDVSIKSLTFLSSSPNPVTIGGANTLTLGTGGLNSQQGAGNATISANVSLGSAQTWTDNSTGVVNVSGAIAGVAANNLTISGLPGNGGFNFSGANTYAGSTTLSTAGASLTLSGANGSILNTSAITLNGGSFLTLDNTGVAGNNNGNRIASTLGITSNGATLTMLGNSNAASSQTVGTLTLGSGQSQVTVTAGSGQTATLTFGSGALASFSRSAAGSAVNFSGTGTIAAPNVTLNNGILGGWATLGSLNTGGSLTTTSTNVVPGPTPQTQYVAPGSATNVLDFATVSGGTVQAASYTNGDGQIATWAATQNIKVSGTNTPTATTINVNSLYLTGNAVVGVATGTNFNLVVGSGGIISNGATGQYVVGGNFINSNAALIGGAFFSGAYSAAGVNTTPTYNGTNNANGNLGSHLFVPAGVPDLVVTTASNIQTNIVIGGTNNAFGITKNGSGVWDIGGGNSDAITNTFTGKTTVNGGILLVRADTNFGAVPGSATPDAITLNGGTILTTAGFAFAGNRGITLGPAGGSIGYIGGSNFTLTQKVTGPGGLTLLATPTSSGGASDNIFMNSTGTNTNNYQGPTTLVVAQHTNSTTTQGFIHWSASNQVPDLSALNLVFQTTAVSGFAPNGVGQIDMNGQSDTVGSLAGNAPIINYNTGGLTVGGNNLSTNYSGSITGTLTATTGGNYTLGTVGTGTFTKNGTGTQTLSGINNYSGNTTVNGGKLLIGSGTTTTSTAALQGLSTVNVVSGALGGNGTINGVVNIQAAGTLAPAMSSTTFNTLTINNNLNFSAGATLNYNFGAAGSPGVGDLVNVIGTGNVVLAAGTDILNVNALAGSGFGIGTYNLITVTGGGTLTNNATFTINGSNAFNYSVAAAGTNLVLTVTAGNPILTWIGNGSPNNSWQVGGPTNWNNGSSAAAFANTSNVIFDDNGTPNQTNINVAAGGVSPNSVLVQNTSGTYTIGGGAITAPAGVNKLQGGNVTFNNNVNTGILSQDGGTFTVGATSNFVATASVTLISGTMQVNGQLTTPTLNLNGGTFNLPGTLIINAGGSVNIGAGLSAAPSLANLQVLGSLSLNNSNASTFNVSSFALASGGSAGTLTFGGTGNISFAGNITPTVVTSVAVNGPGTATLSGNNSFAGGTTLNGGTLALGSATALGSGALTIAGGGIDNVTAGPLTVNNPVNLNANMGYGGTQNLTFSAASVPQAADTTITTAGTGTLTFSGNLTNGGTPLSLTVAGNGSGGVVLNGSTPSFNNFGVGGATSVTVNAPLTVAGNLATSGPGNVNVNGNTTVANAIRLFGGTMNQPDPNTYQFSITGGALNVGAGVTVTAPILVVGGWDGAASSGGQIVLGSGASLVVNNSAANIDIGNNNNAGVTTPGGAVVVGLGNSSVNLSTQLNMNIGAGGNSGSASRSNTLVQLGSGNNTLAANGTIQIGNGGGGGEDGDFTRGDNLGQVVVVLGQGNNTIQTPNLSISGSKSPASVFLAGSNPIAMTTNGNATTPVTSSTYAPPVPILNPQHTGFAQVTINNGAGNQTALIVGNQTATGTGTNSIGVLDTTGGILNGTFGTVTIGFNAGPPTSTHGGGLGSWVLGVANNNVTVNNILMTNTPAGGTQGITGAVFSLNGGTVTFAAAGGGFAYGGAASFTNTNINLNGGLLDMNDNPVLDPTVAPAPLDSFGFNGGTLRNATGVFVTGGLVQNGGVLLRTTAGTTTIGIATTAGSDVYSVGGGAVVQLDAGASNTVALSAGSLARVGSGTLDVVPVSGHLGAAAAPQELVQFTTAPTNVPGEPILPTWIVARTNGTATASADFTVYNGGINSLARFTAYSTGNLNSAAATDVINVTSPVTLTVSPTVYAMKLSSTINGAFGLTIGAAGSASGLIMDGGSISAASLTFASEAAIYTTGNATGSGNNGVINSPITANGNLTKFGPGTLALNNSTANSVAGVNVNAGTLRVLATTNASGAVAVNNSATLAGTGAIIMTGSGGMALGPGATFAPGFARGSNQGNNYGIFTMSTTTGNFTTTSPKTASAPANVGTDPISGNPVIIPNLTSAGLGFGLGISPTNVVGSNFVLSLGAPAATGGINSGLSNANGLGNLASGFMMSTSGGGIFTLDPITTLVINADPANYTIGSPYSYLIGSVPSGSSGGITNLGNFTFINGANPFTSQVGSASFMVASGGVFLNFTVQPVPEPSSVCLTAAAVFGVAGWVRRRRPRLAAKCS
jgi:autotransporter-associated beta strand protein